MKTIFTKIIFFCCFVPSLKGDQNQVLVNLIMLREQANKILTSASAKETLVVANSFILNQNRALTTTNPGECSLTTMTPVILDHLAAATEAEMRENNIAPLFSEIFVPENNEWYISGPLNGNASFNQTIAGYNPATAQHKGVFVHAIEHVELSLEHKILLIFTELARIEMDKKITHSLITTQTTPLSISLQENTLIKKYAIIAAKIGGGIALLHFLGKCKHDSFLLDLAKFGAAFAICSGSWKLASA